MLYWSRTRNELNIHFNSIVYACMVRHLHTICTHTHTHNYSISLFDCLEMKQIELVPAYIISIIHHTDNCKRGRCKRHSSSLFCSPFVLAIISFVKWYVIGFWKGFGIYLVGSLHYSLVSILDQISVTIFVEANNAHQTLERRYRIRHKHQFQLDRKDEKKKTKNKTNKKPISIVFKSAMFDAHFVMMVCIGVGCWGPTNCSYFPSARCFLFHFDSLTLFPFRMLLVSTLLRSSFFVRFNFSSLVVAHCSFCSCK